MDIGIIILCVWGAAFLAMFIRLVRENISLSDVGEEGFDERQNLARGLAYKWGFLAGIVYLFLVQFTALWDDFPLEQHDMAMFGMVFMVAVYSTIAIWKDAFIELGKKELPTILACLLVGLCQIGEGLSERYTISDIAMGCGLVYGAGNLIARRILRRREEKDADE